jgi:hypothetical protein
MGCPFAFTIYEVFGRANTSCSSHLVRFNIVSSAMCVCVTEEGSLNHIFFSCPLYNRSSLFEALSSLQVLFPSSIVSLLYSNNIDIYKVLCSFITENYTFIIFKILFI